MQLSLRLSAVARMVTEGNRLVDVGCDHGYLPVYLVLEKKIPGAIAMDVRKGPLSRAKEHIGEYGLGEYIETRLSDGLKALKEGEGDTLVMAGMGGPLMERILTDGEEVLKGFQELILQPQSDIRHFRRFLLDSGRVIVEEDIVLEDGKFYPMMKAVSAEQVRKGRCKKYLTSAGMPEGTAGNEGTENTVNETRENCRRSIPGTTGKAFQCTMVSGECPADGRSRDVCLKKLTAYTPEEEWFGKLLLAGKHPVLYEYLLREDRIRRDIRDRLLLSPGEGSRKRMTEIEEERRLIQAALSRYEGKRTDSVSGIPLSGGSRGKLG